MSRLRGDVASRRGEITYCTESGRLSGSSLRDCFLLFALCSLLRCSLIFVSLSFLRLFVRLFPAATAPRAQLLPPSPPPSLSFLPSLFPSFLVSFLPLHCFPRECAWFIHAAALPLVYTRRLTANCGLSLPPAPPSPTSILFIPGYDTIHPSRLPCFLLASSFLSSAVPFVSHHTRHAHTHTH